MKLKNSISSYRIGYEMQVTEFLGEWNGQNHYATTIFNVTDNGTIKHIILSERPKDFKKKESARNKG